MDKKSQYIFLLFLIAALVFTFRFSRKSGENMTTVKVGYYNLSDLETLDPANILFTPTWNILHSIYATLLYYDNEGHIRHGAATEYSIDENIIKFKIRDDLLTQSGTPITPLDVVNSIKRLLILNSNTHGNLYSFLACPQKIERMSDDCVCIKPEANTVSFILKSKDVVDDFLNIIVNPDFSIIPTTSIDWQSSNLKIIDFKNTSGPYYLSKITETEAHLVANKGNYLLNPKSPTEIKLIGLPNNNFVESFLEEKIDVIPTFAPMNFQRVTEILDKSNPEDIYHHKTLPLNLQVLFFPKDGPQNLSKMDRFKVAKVLSEAFANYFPGRYDLTPTNELFSSYGTSTLDAEQMKKIYELRASVSPAERTTLKKLTGSVSYMLSETASPFFDHLGITYVKHTMKNYKSDFAFRAFDSGFFDDLSLLTYSQSIGLFNMTDPEFDKWFKGLLQISEPTDKLNYLRDFHYKILSEGHVIPIGLRPYHAFARKPWKLNAYKMYAGSPLWMIEHE